MSKILNLSNYDLIFTTSFECDMGVSGHLYEMIEYFHICSNSNISCAILLSDGIKRETFQKAVTEKYNFNEHELTYMFDRVIECFSPKILRVNNICVVDGTSRFNAAIIYTKNMFLLRCSDKDYTYFSNHKTILKTHLLQDFKVYTERYKDLNIEVINYVKKVLWSRYKKDFNCNLNTALIYLTSKCRPFEPEKVKKLIDKYNFDEYLVISNVPKEYESLKCDKVKVEKPPINNLFSKFSTYIYTPVARKLDCSPRFIVECAASGKNIIYEIDYFDPGLEARKNDIAEDINKVLLDEDDFFIEYVKLFL